MERERERERRFVFFLSYFLGRASPARQRERERSATNWSASLSRSKSVSIFSKHISSSTTTTTITHWKKKTNKKKKEKRDVAPALLDGWMDNIPKGLARLLLVKTSVSKWRTALIYFHLLFFPRYFLVGFYPLPHPVLYRLDEARFPPIPQVGSIFTLGWFTSIYIRPLNKFIFHLCFNANLHKQKRGDPIKQSRDNKKQNKRKTKREL